MSNTVGYYAMLHEEVSRLNGILKDSAAARALNRENIIEDARNRANMMNNLQQGTNNFMMNQAYQNMQDSWNGHNRGPGGPQGGGRAPYSHQGPQGGFGTNNFGGQNPFGGNPGGSSFGQSHNPYGNQGPYGGNRGPYGGNNQGGYGRGGPWGGR